MNAILRYSLATLAIAGLISASPALAEAPKTPAQLIVEDNGNMFSTKAIEKAKETIAESMGAGSRQVHIETFKGLSDAEKAKLEKAGDNKKPFWNEWARAKVTGDRGLMILINRSPGHVHVLADKQMRDHGVTQDMERKIEEMLVDKFKAAKELGEAEQSAARDAALQ